MHRSRLANIVIDCQGDELERAARFWSAALGHDVAPPSGDADDRYRELVVPERDPRILIQRVEHLSRVHLDIESDDVDAEVKRLEELGARRVAQVKQWWVMEAPTGQRFCVVPPQRPGLALHGNPWT